jgi:hypothetical protein
VSWLLLSLALAGEVRGWRHDGTNVWPGDLTHLDPTPSTTPLPAWANASPVLIGDAVCFTAEPTTLGCASRSTGRILWTAAHPVLDALPAEAAAPLRAQLADAERAEAALTEVSRAYSAARREARADSSVEAKVTALAAELDRLRTTIDAVAWFRTPPDREIIGYASATPVTDGARVYALFGNGVLVARTLSGQLVWTRWLGPHRATLRGYDVGTAASPQWVAGRLIVGWEQLLGLDPATGATLWEAGPWRDYGTPAVATVGGVGVLLTPDGRLLRARDGVALQSGLGDLWYIGPTVRGHEAWYVGGAGSAHAPTTQLAATALRLTPDGPDRVRATVAWRSPLPVSDPLYAAPVAAGGRLFTVTSAADLLVHDTLSGALLHRLDLAAYVGDTVYASPIAVGAQLVVAGANGRVALVHTQTYAVQPGPQTAELRATPVWDGARLWLRTHGGLHAVTGR